MGGGKRPKLHVCRGDTVEVIAGNARGARGRVLRALPQDGKVVVEGINMVWKHLRRSQQHPQGGRIEVEAPIDASNVMLLCRNRECERYDMPVRTRKDWTEDGNKIRVCVKCGSEIPKVE
jgi:large subunit ribosomal protein L24